MRRWRRMNRPDHREFWHGRRTAWVRDRQWAGWKGWRGPVGSGRGWAWLDLNMWPKLGENEGTTGIKPSERFEIRTSRMENDT